MGYGNLPGLIEAQSTLNRQGGQSNVYASSVQTGGQHSYSGDEVRAFASYINQVLSTDPDLKNVLPLDHQDHGHFFNTLRDGVIICKLLNVIKPGLIDPRHISLRNSVHHIAQNVNTALRACKEIGIQSVNISAEDFMNCTRHLMLSLLWQIIRKNLVKQINLESHPEMVSLMESGEDLNQFIHMTPENTLLRWFNQQLTSAGHHRKVNNFTSDISDGENYLALMHQIAPNIVPRQVLAEKNPQARAQLVCDLAVSMGLEPFVTPQDILSGNRNLNMAFVADLFNKYPAIAVKQNYDHLQHQALQQAQHDAKMRFEEEERLRKARWEEAEAQRNAQWAAEDNARRALMDAEDRARRERELAQGSRLDDEARRLAAEKDRLEQERRRLEQMGLQAQDQFAQKQRALEEEARRRQEAEQRRAQEERRRLEEDARRMEDQRRKNEENSRRQLEDDRRKLEEERRVFATQTSAPPQQNLVLPAPPQMYASDPYATVPNSGPPIPQSSAVPPSGDYYNAGPVPTYASHGYEHNTYNAYASPPVHYSGAPYDPYASTVYSPSPYGHTTTTTHMYGAPPPGAHNSATTINISGKIKKKAMKNLTKGLPAITAQAQQGGAPGYYPGAPYGSPAYGAPAYGAPGYYPPPQY